jgi:hypothetical protein
VENDDDLYYLTSKFDEKYMQGSPSIKRIVEKVNIQKLLEKEDKRDRRTPTISGVRYKGKR